MFICNPILYASPLRNYYNQNPLPELAFQIETRTSIKTRLLFTLVDLSLTVATFEPWKACACVELHHVVCTYGIILAGCRYAWITLGCYLNIWSIICVKGKKL